MSHNSGSYETEMKTLRTALEACPTGFLSSLRFEIEVILQERDEAYQNWLEVSSRPELRIIPKED